MSFDVIKDTQQGKATISTISLDNLISPLNKEQFFEQYWEQKPFVIKRAARDYYEEILDLPKLNEIFASRMFRSPDMRIFNNGVSRHFSQFSKKNKANGNTVLQEFESGSTIIFENLDRNHIELGKLIRTIENELHIDLRTNVYLTPPEARGFKEHWDTHCVLVMQVYGTKEWEVWDNPIALPLESQKYDPAIGKKANKLGTMIMEEGDIAYIPRGFVHRAKANDQASLHITMGLKPLKMQDLVRDAVKNICKRDVVFRKAMMLKGEMDYDLLKARLIEEIKRTDFDQHKEKLYRKFILERYPILDTQFSSILQSSEIKLNTQCKVKPHMVWKLFQKANELSLLFDGKTVHFPQVIEPTMRYFESQSEFKVADIPGLDDNSKITLAKRLVHEGFIELH